MLRTLPNGKNRTREPLQIGAELYGHAAVESDIEIQRLMMKALAASGVVEAYLDLGHVGVFRSLIRRGEVGRELEAELFRAMQLKDVPEIRALSRKLDAETREALALLPELYGGAEALGRARPATGFSMDLRELASATPDGDAGSRILAPYLPRNAALQRRIESLRNRGEIVVEDLPGHAGTGSDSGCDRRLVRRDGRWVVEKLKS